VTSGVAQVLETALESELLSCPENASMSRAGGAAVAPPDQDTEVMMTNTNRERARQARAALANIPAQLAALEGMDVPALRAKYEEVFGEPTRAGNRDYLRKRIAWRIQELAEGGLSERAKARIQELIADAPIRWRRPRGAQEGGGNGTAASARDPRLPAPGSVLTRIYEGVEHRVTVLEDGFEYGGERFKSLSKVAKAITGQHWNGYLYFGLRGRARGEEAKR